MEVMHACHYILKTLPNYQHNAGGCAVQNSKPTDFHVSTIKCGYRPLSKKGKEQLGLLKRLSPFGSFIHSCFKYGIINQGHLPYLFQFFFYGALHVKEWQGVVQTRKSKALQIALQLQLSVSVIEHAAVERVTA